MDDEAFARAIVALTDTLYRVSSSQLRQRADQEDAVQECLRRAWEKRRTLREERYLKTWLIRILINECRNIQRRGARIVPFDEVPEREFHRKENYSDLYKAVMTLPEEQRIAVALYYMEGYTVREIASMEGTTQSAVKNRLLRARRTLKTLLGDQLEDEE